MDANPDLRLPDQGLGAVEKGLNVDSEALQVKVLLWSHWLAGECRND